MLRDLVGLVAAGRDLDREQAGAAMRAMVSGEASPALAAAFLTSLHHKGETVAEMAGFVHAMRECSLRIQPACEPLVDTCGTGGGDVPTFNISTTAAFVASAAGARVAKHGNRAVTSRCGSADVLEALGVRIDLPPERVQECIEEVGIGFLFAPSHHPAMRHVGPIRRELPFRTVFNCLGPLTNPAGAPCQVIGVYERRLVSLLAEALAVLGTRRALVVHGLHGLDEASTLGPTWVGEVRGGEVRYSEWLPEQAGLPESGAADLAPGAGAAENAQLARSVLAGHPGPRRDIVLLNAGAALLAAGVVETLPAGVALAAAAVDEGAAMARLDAMAAFTNR